MIVIDACVLAKTYLEEQDSDQAVKLLADYDEIIVPRVVRMEVASAINRSCRSGSITESDARLIYARWKKDSVDRWFTIIPDEDIMDAAMALSLKLKHALPDCLYLAVALQFKLPLITADETFYRRCHGHYKKLRLLSEC